MPSTDFPNINGREYSWASVEIRLGTRKYDKISSISYGDSLDFGLVDVNSTIPAGHTRGKWTADDVSVEMPKTEAQALIDDLGDGFGQRVIQITVSYAEDGTGLIKDELPACRITKAADAPGAGGNEPSKMTFTIKPILPIIRNGKRITSLPSRAGL